MALNRHFPKKTYKCQQVYEKVLNVISHSGNKIKTTVRCCPIAVKVKSLSCVPLLATPWTAACQAPLSMQFSRQEY